MHTEILRLSAALFIFYIMLTADISPVNLSTGAAVSVAIASVSTKVFFKDLPRTKMPGIVNLSAYMFFLIFEIYKSSFIYMARIIRNDAAPVVVKVRLSTSNPFVVSIVANSITLTPGTIAIDASGNVLLVLTSKGKKDAKSVETDIKKSFENRLRGR